METRVLLSVWAAVSMIRWKELGQHGELRACSPECPESPRDPGHQGIEQAQNERTVVPGLKMLYYLFF